MTRIAIVATGGTIASEATDAGVVATKTAAQLVERAGLDICGRSVTRSAHFSPGPRNGSTAW